MSRETKKPELRLVDPNSQNQPEIEKKKKALLLLLLKQLVEEQGS